MCLSVPQLAAALQRVFTHDAEVAARGIVSRCNFCS